MRIELADLGRLLNMNAPMGTWFEQTEAVVGFASQKPGAMRAVIVRHWAPTGPIAVVFARTTKNYSVEVPNPAHDHRDQYPKCWLSEDGYIVVSRPLSVAKDHLDGAHRMCLEEDQATIGAVKAARWKTK